MTGAVIASGIWLAVATWAAPPAKSPAPANHPVARPAPRSLLSVQARRLLSLHDYLGFRIFIHKAYAQRLRAPEWYDLKNLVNAYAARAGFDLIAFWNARFPGGKSEIDKALDRADELMLKDKFEDAFAEYQKVAQQLKPLTRTRSDARVLLPFVFHSMARALYGAGRYEESLKVFQWIGTNYSGIRQVIFEKMWAGFKSGHVEIALGAVASQRSAYFSRFLSPEAYLVQTYLYKRLCRTDDLKEVVNEMKSYEKILAKADLKEWVSTDADTLTLWRLAERPIEETDDLRLVTRDERTREQAQIKKALQTVFDQQRPKLLADLKTATAYAHLADVTDTRDVLKPIQKLGSREEYLSQDLEIWPADTTEDWIDEIGKHVLIGESLCRKDK